MSEIVDIVETLENRIQKLFIKMERLESDSKNTEVALQQARIIIKKQTEDLENLSKQYESLKISNTLLGSDENKKDTKLKINSLIREIDYCIAQLSD